MIKKSTNRGNKVARKTEQARTADRAIRFREALENINHKYGRALKKLAE